VLLLITSNSPPPRPPQFKQPKGVLDCISHLSPKCKEAPPAVLLKTLEGLWGEKEQGGRDVYKGISVDIGGGEGEGGEGTKVRIDETRRAKRASKEGMEYLRWG
jgi:hypothetical protein